MGRVFLEIAKYFGHTRLALPFILAIMVFKLASWFEHRLAQTSKDEISNFLRDQKYQRQLGALPDLISKGFNRFFGEKHLSIKCLKNSFLFTTYFLFLTVFVSLLFNYNESIKFLIFVFSLGPKGLSFFISYWILFCLIPGYFMLGKTRFIIWVLQKSSPSLRDLLISTFIDFFISSWMFLTACSISIVFYGTIYAEITGKIPAKIDGMISLTLAGGLLSIIIFLISSLFLITTGSLYTMIPIANLFWASMAPVSCTFLYVFSALLARSLQKWSPTFPVIIRILDTAKHPVEVIGVVAAVLTFFLSLLSVIIGSIIFR